MKIRKAAVGSVVLLGLSLSACSPEPARLTPVTGGPSSSSSAGASASGMSSDSGEPSESASEDAISSPGRLLSVDKGGSELSLVDFAALQGGWTEADYEIVGGTGSDITGIGGSVSACAGPDAEPAELTLRLGRVFSTVAFSLGSDATSPATGKLLKLEVLADDGAVLGTQEVGFTRPEDFQFEAVGVENFTIRLTGVDDTPNCEGSLTPVVYSVIAEAADGLLTPEPTPTL